jgi:hypothetical protein
VLLTRAIVLAAAAGELGANAVGNLGAAALKDEHVLGLEVAVDEAVCVAKCHCVDNVQPDA